MTENNAFPSNDLFENKLGVVKTRSVDDIMNVMIGYDKSKSLQKDHYQDDTDGIKRDAICGLSYGLNERGIIAPVFRPFIVPLFFDKTSVESVMFHFDKQVLDLHYLFHNHKDDVRPKDIVVRKIFSKDEFDINLAEEFANRAQNFDDKVIEIGVPENVQYELAIFRRTFVRDRWKEIRRSTKEMSENLISQAARKKSRFKKENVDIREKEYTCLKLASGSPSEAARLFKLMPVRIDCNDENLEKRFQRRIKFFEETFDVRVW